MKYSDITHRLAAAATVGAMLTGSEAAFAQGFNNIATKIESSTNALPNLISLLGYIGGSGLAVAGVFKLKNHVDNPGQTPMKDGLVRLGAGGGLLAVPSITKAMQETISTTTKADMSSMKFSAAAFTTP